mmetsp:Transcript_30465/g.97210  ORF Transcript_30465/g.97210 Transcript_30465/m.97210 type:complete len:156 (-) Transcript_30465:52-519(-)
MAEVAMDVEVDDVLAAQRQGGRLRRLRDGSNLRFRNYRPRDEKLRELFEKTPRAILYLDLEEVAAAPLSEDQQKAVEALTAIQRELKEQLARQDPNAVNIAPKKATWDLKRDIEKKLKKLERRTQRAIVEILRAKMAEEEEESDEEDDEEEDDLE